MTAPTLKEVERVVSSGGDADDVLREVVAILHERARPLRADQLRRGRTP